VTYQSFAAAWPSMTDEDGFADRMNSIPKFVASTTLVDADWNATVIDGDVVDAVSGLKQEHDLLVMGSGALVHALRQHDLIDVYELWVHPVVVGEGKRLFSEPTTPGDLQLLGAKTTGKGVAILTYGTAGRAA
jgi:dihydrofolate reductase